jgi:hypothetical protein
VPLFKENFIPRDFFFFFSFFSSNQSKILHTMNDLLVFTSYEQLQAEQARLDQSEAWLNESVRLRSALLKREEAANQRQLTNLLIRAEMLRCESECLQALAENRREWVEALEKRCHQMANEARRASLERKQYNERVTDEISRLCKLLPATAQSAPPFALLKNETEKMDAVVQNYAQLAFVRSAVDAFPARHQELMRRLEASANEGREQHMRSATELSRACYDLKTQILGQRRVLREMHAPEEAAALVVWAESVGKTARAKARWDVLHQVCMLGVVVMEGLRLRVEDGH